MEEMGTMPEAEGEAVSQSTSMRTDSMVNLRLEEGQGSMSMAPLEPSI